MRVAFETTAAGHRSMVKWLRSQPRDLLRSVDCWLAVADAMLSRRDEVLGLLALDELNADDLLMIEADLTALREVLTEVESLIFD